VLNSYEGGWAFLDIDFRLITSPSSSQGVALVRDLTTVVVPDPDPDPSEVPSPGSMAFLGLSMLFVIRLLKENAKH
jgi:hypothetical protein